MVMPTENIADLPIVDEIIREVSITQAIEIIGRDPTGVSINQNRLVDAVWFSIGDIPYALAVYVAPSRYQEGSIPLVPEDVILFQPYTRYAGHTETATVSSSLRLYRTLVKTKNIIMQLLIYLYVIDNYPEKIKEWLTKLSGSWRGRDKNYDSTNFPRVLPLLATGGEIMAVLSEKNIPYIKGGKILIDTQEMFKALVYHINKFRETVPGIKREYFINRYREIDNYYSSVDDFRPSPNLILLSDRQLDEWVRKNILSSNPVQRQLQIMENNINFRIDPQAFVLEQPFIYQESGSSLIRSSLDPSRDRFYLVQNVAAGVYGLDRALVVASTWALERRNLGYRVEFTSTNTSKVLVHKLYTLDAIGSLILYKDNSGGKAAYLKILMYPDSNGYAALLPLNQERV